MEHASLYAVYLVAAIVVNVIGAVATVGTLFWKLGALNGSVRDLKFWLEQLTEGNGPVCAAHEQKLADHDRRLDEHGGRISRLEDR